MSNDAHNEQVKDGPTEGTSANKPYFRQVLPESVEALLGIDSDETRIEADSERPPASDGNTTATRPGRLSRRGFVMLASGATVAAVGAPFGTATPTTTVTQPDAYGYGGASAGPDGGTTTVVAKRATTITTQTTDNDERANALEISPGTLVEAELDADSVEWFTFDATADDQITVDYERSSSVGVTGVVLYGSDGQFINQLYVGTESLHQLKATANETGSYFLQVVDVEDGSGPYSFTVRLEEPDTGGTEQTPYFDSARTIPGRIQTQNFDNGGQNTAYYDTTEANEGGSYRPAEYVDIEKSGDSTNKYTISHLKASEWLEYTVDVTAGTYTLNVRVATDKGGAEYHVLVGGETIATVAPSNTGGKWETVTVDNVEVPSGGSQRLRIEIKKDGGRLNWLELVDEADSTYGTQAYGKHEYGG